MHIDRFPAVAAARADGRVIADNAGGTQVPRECVEAVGAYLARDNAQKGGTFARKIRTTETVERARAAYAELAGVPPETIGLGANSTTIALAMSRALASSIRPGDRIVVTDSDHYANVVPWTSLRRFGAEVDRIPVDARGELDERAFAQALAREPVLVALPWASNGTGNVFDVARLSAAAQDAGALVIADAVQAAPHVSLTIPDTLDALFFSTYKVYGPHLGVWYARPELAERFFTADEDALPSSGVHWSMETGTQSHETLAGWLGTAEYLRGIGDGSVRTAIARIDAYERELAAYARARFAERADAVTLYGRPAKEERLPVFAFNVRGVAPQTLAETLEAHGVEAALGDYYTPRLMRTLAPETNGVAVRLSFAHYNDTADIDQAFRAIDAVIGIAA
ncbi:cysteine desulfurase-like protein [Vulcanimicrobium alpinum]|uniref:Cysteine desulfurase-like protein n=1 Tax=Vulcanimicrobium alpinum TaxID=3016050 RepID=A0AAN1XT81_UNVUL|nr:aminotransferase class V-fold PLP-dependent enzyme [Vulcanimicrobium alpinum]BDE05224.1 cysteine desulfurase-like protein [Vulcanimicrobium alpinum]